MEFDLSIFLFACLLALTGNLVGGWLMWRSRLFQRPPFPRYGYIGGVPIVLGTLLMMATPGQPLGLEAFVLGIQLVVAAGIGFLRDSHRITRSTAIFGVLLTIACGATTGLRVSHPSIVLEWSLTLIWPLVVIFSFKLASIVFEMPFLLCLGSAITFLLFFSGQMATPPWAWLFTAQLLLVPVLALAASQGWRRRVVLGDSGTFALGFLMAGISMMGRSKTLLLFGLLVPAMVIVYPFVLISFLIIGSYLGNELYHGFDEDRHPRFVWNLHRERLLLFTGLVFLSGNFLGLLLDVRASPAVFLLLFVLLLASLASFLRTYARRRRKSTPVSSVDSITILGVRVASLKRSAVVDRLRAWADEGRGFHHVVTADSLAIVRARREPEFAAVMERAELVIPDGAGLIWAADFLGSPLPDRIPGISLVDELCHLAETRQWPVFFLGAKPGVAEIAVQRLRERAPGLPVAGIHHGYLPADSAEEAQAIERIQAAAPRLLFVAMGVPRQEYFIRRLRSRLDHLVVIGVGGSFDVISGQLPRAPVLMQRFGLEWLFRLWKEPWRFHRILNIPVFVLDVLRHKVRRT